MAKLLNYKIWIKILFTEESNSHNWFTTSLKKTVIFLACFVMFNASYLFVYCMLSWINPTTNSFTLILEIMYTPNHRLHRLLISFHRVGYVGLSCPSTTLGFPPEFLVTVYVRKWSVNFFHFHYGKGSGNPEFRNDFFRKPEISGTLFWNYGTLRNRVPENSGLRNNCSGKRFRKTLKTS